MTQAGQAGKQVEDVFKRFGSLINFVMLFVSFIGFFMFVGSWKTTVETDVVSIKSWQTNHEAYHRDRLADLKEFQGSVNARLNEQARSAQEDRRSVDSIAQRLTAVEKAVDTVETNATTTTAALNKLSGDMQVVKEILTRIEKQRGS